MILPRVFQLRNRRFPSVLLRVAKSTKRKPSAAVTGKRGREYLQTRATVNVKNAMGGRIAVPGRAIRRDARGVVKSLRPVTLLTSKVRLGTHDGCHGSGRHRGFTAPFMR